MLINRIMIYSKGIERELPHNDQYNLPQRNKKLKTPMIQYYQI